ncbi:SNF2 family N-terminal domain-domain-containing protein [Clohesyomyces aquaticus]|uniref:DNA helicase n=1 Tax=Clohesyomyces aquaticus TaxID=1231657 RepID=A0A1Y1Y598_9PLEO|nr:SNF2 family N-terminal domain-domain-containing protein [Clohesyomyces aquaticus]
MNMSADVKLAAQPDCDVHPPPETPNPADASAAQHGDATFPPTSAVSIKAEEEPQADDGENGSLVQRPAKRRRLDDLTPSRSASRAVSPPWRPFAANGPTTIITNNGIRKSGRVNKDAPPPVATPVKRSTRNATKAIQPNGTGKGAVKKNVSRGPAGPAASSKSKSTSSNAHKAAAPGPNSPAQRKSDRQRKAPTAAAPTSPALQNGHDGSARRRTGRRRKSTLTPADEPEAEPFSTPMSHYSNGLGPCGTHVSPTDENSNAPFRLKLRLRKPEPPNRHPHHVPPPSKFPSFTDWLEQDDALEGEEDQRISQEQAADEAERRLRIVDAAENGVLVPEQCSVFIPEAAEEPPPRYGHWSHVVAHAIHFNKLLQRENTEHRKLAKMLAREAVDYWKEKYKRKTQEEIEQEEVDRALLRYKQLVKDVKDSWSNVKAEVDKERVAKWEEEQLQLGHKAMDDMFNQAQEILGRNVIDSTSSFISEDRESEDGDVVSESGALHVSRDSEEDENMSSSGESEDGHDNDEDAKLTYEQLQAKYGQLPDLPDSSFEERSEDDEDNEEGGQTPEATLDPDLEMLDANEPSLADILPANPYANANGHANGIDEEEAEDVYEKASEIDPATVDLEEVDEALLDSEDEDKGSASGSEEWVSGEESEDSRSEPGSGSEDDADLGVLGFLSSAEIKQMKAAAKASMDIGNEMNEEEPQADDGNKHDDDSGREQGGAPNMNGNGVNEHDENPSSVNGIKSTIAEGHETMASPAVNGHSHVKKHIREHFTSSHNAVGPEPSIEMEEAEEMETVSHLSDIAISRGRSRHGSSPPRTEIPSLLRGTLREYQHDGLDWLANLYESDTNGILADEMGLGKTIQTISLLAYLAVDRGMWGPHLVVVPTSVMLNWEMEFKKWCPGFKILTYYGDIAERKRKRTGWRTEGKDMFNVVITSYQLILQDASAFKMRAWQYLVLDEAHNIKNFKSQRWQTLLNFRTQRRLLLTGTPLQNNIDELWSLLYFLMPAGFAGEGRIAGLEEFTMALKNPTSQILEQGRQQLDAEAQKIVKKLHEVLRPYLLRRLKADVEKQMPAKYEHVVYCKLSKRQRQLYDGFMGRAATKEILASGNYMSIINCLMSLRKVCNHPDLFETRAIVTSMAMPKSVVTEFEIKDLIIRKRLYEGMQDKEVSLDALNLVFARREQTSMLHARRAQQIRATRPLEDLIERQTRRLVPATHPSSSSCDSALKAMADRQRISIRDHLQACLDLTRARTQFLPVYGRGLIDRLTMSYEDYKFGAAKELTEEAKPQMRVDPGFKPQFGYPGPSLAPLQEDRARRERERWGGRKGQLGFRAPRSHLRAAEWHRRQISIFESLVPTLEQRSEALEPLITRFNCVTPAVAAEDITTLTLTKAGVDLIRSSSLVHTRDPFHESRIRQSIAFPDKRLLQYDCGKLQRLAVLLRDLQAGGHRALIFTQMTKVLDILEQFLNIHGHRYLRLDGATKVEQRQILTDRFNTDPRILCFILSSRSGGLGINLTGADTVIFYDLDWNPAMDKQCQDRSHRIGQTRDVHIYKFVSEHTIEANILRKSNQKRLLDDVIIQKGDFTTDYFQKVSWRDALDSEDVEPSDEASKAMNRVLGEKAGLLGDAKVMRNVEDKEDQTAASIAQKEIEVEMVEDQGDFNEASNTATPPRTRAVSEAGDERRRLQDGDLDAVTGHVDEYMLGWGREEWGKEPYRPPTERQKQKKGKRGVDVHRRPGKRRQHF